MRIGTSTIDITPKPGIEMCGFLARVQPSVDVHDPLLARALYINSETQKLLWLHADLIAFEHRFVAEIKAELSKQYGLRSDQIVLTTTHTHSGPPTIHLINAGSYDADYVTWLKKRLLESAAGALDQTEPVDLLAAEGRCELAVDRRGKPTTHTDPRVAVFAWRRSDGTFAAVLCNYPIHNVGLGANNRSISADMAGRAARTISAQLPGSPVVLFTNGACGNLNPPQSKSDFIQKLSPTPDYDKMERWGDQLAEAVVAVMQNARVVPNPTIASELATFHLHFDAFDADQVKQLADKLHDEMAGKQGYVPDRYRDAVATWKRMRLALLAQGGQMTTGVPLDIQLVCMGPVYLVCLAAEVFSVLADELRERVDVPLYVVGYANGDVGYLAPSVAYDEGGYEIESAFVFYGGLPVKRGEFERLRDQTAQLLESFIV